ncbi:MAG: lysophospholipid acyltransferase family protein [Planctomycetota bacterium]
MPRNDEKPSFRHAVIGVLGAAMIRSLGVTWRIQELDREHEEKLHEAGERLIYSFWHGGMLIPAWARRGSGTCVMISRHGDGELIARVIARLGLSAERGSTTRGGPGALRRMARLEGKDLAMTPDGPKGPRHRAQPGVVLLAQRTRRPILPVGLTASPAWKLSSWDGFLIPRPFARVCIAFEPPIRCAPDADEAERDRLRQELEQRMWRATARAERAVGLEPERTDDEVSQGVTASPGAGK